MMILKRTHGIVPNVGFTFRPETPVFIVVKKNQHFNHGRSGLVRHFI